MSSSDQDFLRQVLPAFKLEADEQIKSMSSGLIELEKVHSAEGRKRICETMLRQAHNLKGAAGTVNLSEMGHICQEIEEVISAVAEERVSLAVGLFDSLHEATDTLRLLLLKADQGLSEADKEMVAKQVERLQFVSSGSDKEGKRSIKPDDDRRPISAVKSVEVQAGTVRVPTERLDSLLFQSEELISAKMAAVQRFDDIAEASANYCARRKEWSAVHPEIRKLRKALEEGNRSDVPQLDSEIKRILDFVENEQSFRKTFESELINITRMADSDQRSLSSMVDNLLDDLKHTLLLPFSTLLSVYPRMVRDMVRAQDKDISLEIVGADIEVDKRILEEMKDAMTHVVRNCVDHGIESRAERMKCKKSQQAHIRIEVSKKARNMVQVKVSDDGAGINTGEIRRSALKNGIITPEQSEGMNDQDVLSLIYQSGVTTSPLVTEISGRGVGMAVVREKIEKLGGSASITSEPGAGTEFRFKLPLTLATFRGILVRAGGRPFIIPTSSVIRFIYMIADDVKNVENRRTISLNGRVVSLVKLTEVLGFVGEEPKTGIDEGDSSFEGPAAVLGSMDKHIAFQVDEILGEREVVVKSLGKQLVRVRNIAGATVLSNGDVVPILYVPDLLKSATTGAQPAGNEYAVEEVSEHKGTVMVVEDSITTRTLLKNILETAGYKVVTASNARDALSIARGNGIDIFVSDVMMPEMNGFDLTASVRADEELAELPVVLVTSLDSDEDRERGIDVGANAYLVKKNFDQGDLLQIIRQLI